ncbi:MAG: hypothetical protein RLZZ04_419 [Cyanobacteriota bacterium]|jgi:hypothetical protein
MANLPNNHQNNLVSFLRHHRPVAPVTQVNLEQRLMDALESPSTQKKPGFYLKVAWTIPRALATGFLFTSVSFGFKTPRIALEPNDLDKFLVKNWQDTLDSKGYSYTTAKQTEAYWLLPTISEPQPALSVSAK